MQGEGSATNGLLVTIMKTFFCRVAPLYYLINLGMFSIFEADCYPKCYFSETTTVFLTLSMTNTFFFLPSIEYLPFPPSETSWFITVMVPFYMMLPVLLPTIQKYSSCVLSKTLVLLFYLQCWPILLTR